MNKEHAKRIRDHQLAILMRTLRVTEHASAPFIQNCMEHAFEAGVSAATPIAEQAVREALAQSRELH